jgi:hypothetical protein
MLFIVLIIRNGDCCLDPATSVLPSPDRLEPSSGRGRGRILTFGLICFPECRFVGLDDSAMHPLQLNDAIILSPADVDVQAKVRFVSSLTGGP